MIARYAERGSGGKPPSLFLGALSPPVTERALQLFLKEILKKSLSIQEIVDN